MSTLAYTPSDSALRAAARDVLRSGDDLREAEHRFHLALLDEAVEMYGSKLKAAERLGVHRNTISRLGLHRRKRAVQRVRVARRIEVA